MRIGMTITEASAALGEPLVVDSTDLAEGCAYGFAQSFGRQVGFMVTGNRVARVDIDTAGILNREGLGVGSSEAELLAAYGTNARIEPHPYDSPEWHYVVYLEPADTTYGYVFETDGAVVHSYRAGHQPEILYIEGCL